MSHPVHPNRQALSATELAAQLAQLNAAQAPGWQLANGALEKTFSFKNYYETISFVNALAFIAHAQDHHPELAVTFNRCTMRFSTHDVQGISMTDFFCASHVDALLA
jgi:4a-hydroxytetrahydrobiopterin dehydratase